MTQPLNQKCPLQHNIHLAIEEIFLGLQHWHQHVPLLSLWARELICKSHLPVQVTWRMLLIGPYPRGQKLERFLKVGIKIRPTTQSSNDYTIIRIAVGVQVNSKKKSYPAFSVWKSTREAKVGHFKQLMVKVPSKVHIPHPKIWISIQIKHIYILSHKLILVLPLMFVHSHSYCLRHSSLQNHYP